MFAPVAETRRFFSHQGTATLRHRDLHEAVGDVTGSTHFRELLLAVTGAAAFSPEFGAAFVAAGAANAIAPCRALRFALNASLDRFFSLLSEVAAALGDETGAWSRFAARIHASDDLAALRLSSYLTRMAPKLETRVFFGELVDRLTTEDPHAVYPTSIYRECDGRVEVSGDGRSVEAVMSLRTSTSIRMVDNIFALDMNELRDVYRPLGRCICVVDRDVEALYGAQIERYFRAHGIPLTKVVYRATEADKGLATVERMLGDFKRIGVSRSEPVLIVGGGVLADTGGLACALYGRNTPYVMVATSIVSGIDAGPSPRTCCDGFGYKNLLGAYHPPVLCITDRFFFATLREGWLRHGVAEIIKIAAVKNAALFHDLERAQTRLVTTRFGTVGCDPSGEIGVLAQRILAGAMRSYVEAEYDNLYETHQCRPHAYGHTWSPGFEMAAGLLHGHAVSIDMGLGAYLALRAGWLDRSAFERILSLVSTFGLSLWHDICADADVMWESHSKILQKRGGNLVAPLPKGEIGACGYLNELSRAAFFSALGEYRLICAGYARGGIGIDPLCSDVGLEDPSLVGTPLSH